MTGYTLQIFKVIDGVKELVAEVRYPYASGTEMMDIIYGARHFGIATYFGRLDLPKDVTYDLDFVRLVDNKSQISYNVYIDS
jgi:hypothetical protein